MNRNQVAAKVAQRKADHPEQFCPAPRCLWRTGDGGYCPRHAQAAGNSGVHPIFAPILNSFFKGSK